MKTTETQPQGGCSNFATGRVISAFGNLLLVEFEGNIRQGEVGMIEVQDAALKGEVIEINGNRAKIQVFEDTRGIRFQTPIRFTGELLEAELGPGLLTSIFDGLQNPLEKVAEEAGFFLPRGLYLPSLDRVRLWDYLPVAQAGAVLERGDVLGTTQEGRFPHNIMVPFALYGTYTVIWTIAPGAYTVDTIIARAKDQNGIEHAFTMIQKWPIKNSLSEGEKVKPSKMIYRQFFCK